MRDLNPSFPSFACSSHICFLHSHLHLESLLLSLCGSFFPLPLLIPSFHPLHEYLSDARKAGGKEEHGKVMKDARKDHFETNEMINDGKYCHVAQ